MKIEFFGQIFKLISKIKLHEIPSSVIAFIPKKNDIKTGKNDGNKAAELMIKLTSSCHAITMPYLSMTRLFFKFQIKFSVHFVHSLQQEERLHFLIIDEEARFVI